MIKSVPLYWIDIVLQVEHDKVKIQGLDSRYLPPKGINRILESMAVEFDISTLGHSVEDRPIQMLKIGEGPVKILMWSQMHGNETTTTRALFDLMQMFLLVKGARQDWLEHITIYAIPILNPDGAARYSRQNANGVDLNRDAQLQSQPETKALFSAYKKVQPDFCINLHDQRTRYAVGNSQVPSTLAFLSPSADKLKTITPARKVAMQLIAGIFDAMHTKSNIGISRYDDAFNGQCVGDTFSSMGTPTLLFEAGHYPGDYNRHITRKYIYESLYILLDLITQAIWHEIDHQRYFDIPENNTSFADIVLQNGHSQGKNSTLPLNFEEQLVDGEIRFIPKPISDGYATSYFGHKTYDLSNDKDVNALKADTRLSAYI